MFNFEKSSKKDIPCYILSDTALKEAMEYNKKSFKRYGIRFK